jgi:hypothetical protein
MGRQCPSCNKLAGLDTEVDDVSLELDGTSITGTVHVIRRSQCCSEDMKEATFDVDINLLDSNADLEEHKEEGHELEAEFDEGEVTESGGGRYKKNLIGFKVEYTVKCSCQKEGEEPLVTGTAEDNMAASGYDEMT